jgi:hypothetical protein
MSCLVSVCFAVPEARVRRHHSSKRDGTKRHHRHRVKRSNTCATPQDSATRHPQGADLSLGHCISVTPSPERSHASCSLMVRHFCFYLPCAGDLHILNKFHNQMQIAAAVGANPTLAARAPICIFLL